MKFYVYRIFNAEGLLYIGKGSGPRLRKQKRSFGAEGEVVQHFEFEEDAYAEEVRLIALHSPPLNRHPGGQGGRAGVYHERPPLPSGLTPEGLQHAAPYLARILAIWRRDESLVGLLSIFGSFVTAHGLAAVEEAVLPYLKRLVGNDLVLENKP